MMNTGYKTCNADTCAERRRLLQEIGTVDTHPYDQQAMEAFKHYNMAKNKMVTEYTQKYGPLVLSIIDTDCGEWKWATQDWPWEGGYH